MPDAEGRREFLEQVQAKVTMGLAGAHVYFKQLIVLSGIEVLRTTAVRAGDKRIVEHDWRLLEKLGVEAAANEVISALSRQVP